ncbi:hypothetical protein Q5P01_016520 [Channa striata]|uniref:Inactive N-acetylated-alpha-linked acidic dipeptidase-like protein 2 n=1 Tax=Channa striata TaxID=64152 RepID=A0AA88SGN0_CHASR|nr:hypothetical protein Q5P01_016520 [Channa striata]
MTKAEESSQGVSKLSITAENQMGCSEATCRVLAGSGPLRLSQGSEDFSPVTQQEVIRKAGLLEYISPDKMAYRKVGDTQAGPLVGEVLHCSRGLDLDWDLDKEDLQEPGPSMERMQMQHVDCQISGCSDPGPDPDPELMEPIQPSVSVSPHGRFERLQEDPNYISHFTRAPGHKGQRRLHCFLLRYFLGASGLFILGLLIGWFTHTPTRKLPVPQSDSSDLLEDLLKEITADKINALQR